MFHCSQSAGGGRASGARSGAAAQEIFQTTERQVCDAVRPCLLGPGKTVTAERTETLQRDFMDHRGGKHKLLTVWNVL